MNLETDIWLSAHLFYAGDWEQFLLRGVKPFIEKMVSQHLAKQYFFIRYWECGPHIRLRIKGNEENLLHFVKPEVDTFFCQYFALHPSCREEPAWVKELPVHQRWYPNNSVQFLIYEPEVERYGGIIGAEIAEKFFQASSRVTLAIYQDYGDWSYNLALGTAVKLHLAFAVALKMDLLEAASFFTFISNRWLPAAYANLSHFSIDEAVKHRKRILKTFGKSFDQQRKNLIPYFQTIWHALCAGGQFEQEWLNQWVLDLLDIDRELNAAQNHHQLIIPDWFQPDLTLQIPSSRQALWSILESYIHMTNNRLGVFNHDEAYLGYLMKSSLDCLLTSQR